MTEQNHLWCRDVRRDEAVRAAEDAAAVPAIQHRDLPEAVAELRERVARLEEARRVARLEAAQATIGTGDVFRDVGCGSTADEVARLTAERDAAIRERDEAKARLARCLEGSDVVWSRLLAVGGERDAARAECERLRAAGDAMAEALTWDQSCAYDAATTRGAIRQRIKAWNEASARVAELEAAQPPRGWLTAEEREAVEKCLRHFVRQEIDFLERNDPGHRWLEVWRREEAILRALLARETPPRVKVPPGIISALPHEREQQWITAIRAAGGEVEG